MRSVHALMANIWIAVAGAVFLLVCSNDICYAQVSPDPVTAAWEYFPSEKKGYPTADVKRLTQPQLDATVRALFPGIQIPSVKASMPRDNRVTNYEYYENLRFTDANFGGYTEWKNKILGEVLKKPSLAFSCAGQTDQTKCFREKVKEFYDRAYRGDTDGATFIETADALVRGVEKIGVNKATLVAAQLPLEHVRFVYRGETKVGSDHRLIPTQHLQTLTYEFADSPPEALGFKSNQAAQYLAPGATIDSTYQTILKSPAAREKLVRFFQHWLEVREPNDANVSEVVFPEFTEKYRQTIYNHFDKMLREKLNSPSPKLKAITQAHIDHPFSNEKHFGLFTHPAVVTSHSAPESTGLIKRGVFWTRKVMCMEMQPPPAVSDDQKPVLKPGMTERQRVDTLSKQSACVGCHRVINPFGFFMESYDPLGRWRTLDENKLPIDVSMHVGFLEEGQVKTNTTAGAIKALTSSLMFKQCFIRNMFRFYTGREETETDHETLRKMFLAFVQNDEQDIMKPLAILMASDQMTKRVPDSPAKEQAPSPAAATGQTQPSTVTK